MLNIGSDWTSGIGLGFCEDRVGQIDRKAAAEVQRLKGRQREKLKSLVGAVRPIPSA